MQLDNALRGHLTCLCELLEVSPTVTQVQDVLRAGLRAYLPSHNVSTDDLTSSVTEPTEVKEQDRTRDHSDDGAGMRATPYGQSLAPAPAPALVEDVHIATSRGLLPALYDAGRKQEGNAGLAMSGEDLNIGLTAVRSRTLATKPRNQYQDLWTALERHDALLRQAAAEEDVDPVALSAMFFAQHFEQLSDALLSVVAPDWLHLFADTDKDNLFYSFFTQAPPDAALTSLLSHLGSVERLQTRADNDVSATVTAVAADTAADLLTQRFCLPSSTGIQELGILVAARAHLEACKSRQGPKVQSLSELARLLASIPERAVRGRAAAFLRAESYVPLAARRLLDMLTAGPSPLPTSTESPTDPRLAAPASTSGRDPDDAFGGPSSSTQGGASGPMQEPFANGVGVRVGLPGPRGEGNRSELGERGSVGVAIEEEATRSSLREFVGEVLARFCRRGHAAVLARTLWALDAGAGPEVRGQAVDVQGTARQEADAEAGNNGRCMKAGTSKSRVCAALLAVQDPAGLQGLLEELVLAAPQSGVDQHQAAAIIASSLAAGLWDRTDVRYLLGEKLLLHKTLPPAALDLLVASLAMLDMQATQAGLHGAGNRAHVLEEVVVPLSQAWEAVETVQRVPVKQQAYTTAALMAFLPCLGRDRMEGDTSLMPGLLRGVGTRLESPLSTVRRQGMRLGNALVRVLDPERELLFGPDVGSTDLLLEEAWHSSCLPAPSPPTLQPKGMPNVQAGEKCHEAQATDGEDADSLASGTDSDDDSLAPYDMPEDDDSDGPDAGDKPLQLRDVVGLLRKGDEPKGIMRALKVVGPLLQQLPDELPTNAGDLVRALLHTRPPEWGDEEANSPEEQPQQQRSRALVDVLFTVPGPAGQALLKEVYSPHLDVHQRLIALEGFAMAAKQMAALPAQATAGAAALPGHAHAGRTRIYAPRALAKLSAVQRLTLRNRFPEVALEWATGLLRECDVPRHGVDLFGRDALLLGRLLVTLGTFVEAAAPAPVTVQLASALLELVRSPRVHASDQPYVRRAALVATCQVMGALPPARLAGAMLLGPPDSFDGMLMERLDWARSWAEAASTSDIDPQCRDLAGACRALQASLAQRAMQAASDAGPSSFMPLPAALPDIKLPPTSFHFRL